MVLLLRPGPDLPISGVPCIERYGSAVQDARAATSAQRELMEVLSRPSAPRPCRPKPRPMTDAVEAQGRRGTQWPIGHWATRSHLCPGLNCVQGTLSIILWIVLSSFIFGWTTFLVLFLIKGIYMANCDITYKAFTHIPISCIWKIFISLPRGLISLLIGYLSFHPRCMASMRADRWSFNEYNYR